LYSYQSFSPEDTLALAKKLGTKLQGGEILVLEGDLGAGKTHFVKGLAEGLGAKGPVTSPTFTLLHLYEGRVPLAHFDVYRLSSPEAFEELGYEEYFSGPGVTAIEWGDLISPYLPSEYLQIEITHLYQEESREGRLITFYPHGEFLKALVKELAEDACLGN
jgi:tRNA threonylcarbamoyladenosine biosynthesis protein TsaE